MTRSLAVAAIAVLSAAAVAAAPASGAPTTARPAVTAPAYGPATIWLSEGSTGDQVREVQTIFAGHGWTIDVDGQYGPQTSEVVTRFQEMSGLLPDGIVGPVTWAALQSTIDPASASAPAASPSAPTPKSGDCESWQPLFDRYGIPFDAALPLMRRESRCVVGAHNGNSGTADDSFGPLQTNRFGRLAAWWDSGGYTAAVMSTPEGAVAAAAVLYRMCGWGPWDRANGYPCYGSYTATPTPRWGEW